MDADLATRKLIACINRTESTLPTLQQLCNRSLAETAARAACAVLDGMRAAGVKFKADSYTQIVCRDTYDVVDLVQTQLKKRDGAGLSQTIRSLGLAMDAAARQGVKVEVAGSLELKPARAPH